VLVGEMDRLPQAFDEAIGRSLFKSVQHIRTASLQSGRVPYKTGTLRRSITASVEGNEGLVGSNLPYAPIHEFGGTFTRHSAWGRPTAPYVVTYKGLQYLGKPFEDSLPEVTKIFEDELSSAVS